LNALRTIFELEANQIVLNFAHGLVFFLLGFAVLLKSKRWSDLTLAKSLRWLGVFGVLNAFGDWGSLFLPIQEEVLSAEITGVLWVLDIAVTALSYAFLLYFGCRLAADTRHDLYWLPRLVPILYGAWLLALVVAIFSGVVDPVRSPESFRPFQVMYLYGFAFAGSMIVAWALHLQQNELRSLGLDNSVPHLRWVGLSMALHAFAAGIIVPEIGVFPASIINDAWFFASTGIPARLLTGISGAIMAIFITISMEVFDEEFQRRIDEARRVRAVLDERVRIARDLHDGIIQTLYALGLGLEGVLLSLDTSKETAKEEIKSIMNSLNTAIKDVRGYIMNLKTPNEDVSLDEQIRLLVRQLQREARVPVRLRAEAIEAGIVSGEAIENILLIIREAVSNATRHAKASEIKITLVRDERAINLSVADDGVGFDPSEAPQGSAGEHLGLDNMRRRAEGIGGHLSIHAEPGHGTEVLLRLPLSPNAR